jgi:hypothetical protein
VASAPAATVTALRAAAIAQSARSVAAGGEMVVGSDGVADEGGFPVFEVGFFGDLCARWLI